MNKIGIHAPHLCIPFTGRHVYTLNLLSSIASFDQSTPYTVFTHQVPTVNLNLPPNFTVKVIPGTYGKRWDQQFTQSPAFQEEGIRTLLMTHFVIPRNFGGNLIVIIHDLNQTEFYTLKNLFSGKFPFKLISLSGMISRLIEPYQINRADAIITISETVRNNVVKLLKVPYSRITRVYNGIDHVSLNLPAAEEQSAILQQYNIKQPYLLYVGGMGYKKNVGRLVRAYRQCQPELAGSPELVMVGDGFWRSKLEKKYQTSIRWLDRVERNILLTLMNNARLFVFPSLMEGFGFPPVEAKMLGIPVITSNNSPMQEVLMDDAMYFDPYKTDSISHAIREAWNGDLRRIPLSKEKVNQFSWEKCAKSIHTIIKQFD